MARRSREEVIEYLTSKPWYSSFKKIVLKKNKIGVRGLINEIINLDNLIVLAFKWSDTQEGRYSGPKLIGTIVFGFILKNNFVYNKNYYIFAV